MAASDLGQSCRMALQKAEQDGLIKQLTLQPFQNWMVATIAVGLIWIVLAWWSKRR
jgi:hypothetical protein